MEADFSSSINTDYSMDIIREYNGVKIPQREDGYINLTRMADATRKRSHDYLRLESTNEFLKSVASRTGCPVSQLVYIIRNNQEGQGTYAHPKVAINFAQWANPDFAAEVSEWVFELMTKGTVSIAPPKAPDNGAFNADLSSVPLLLNILDSMGVHRPLAGTKLLEIVGQKHNQLTLTNETKALIGNSNPEVDKFYTATEIGKLLTPSASGKKVNIMLAGLGIITKNAKKEWELTDYTKAEKLAVLIPFTAGNQHSGFTIKYKADVIPLLQAPETDTDEEE